MKLAQDTLALEHGNRARDVDRRRRLHAHRPGQHARRRRRRSICPSTTATRATSRTARSRSARRSRPRPRARFAAVTDVVNAYAAFETNQKIVGLYQSGYLDQAQQSLDITTYVYQHGAGTLLDLLDAERTYRATRAGVPPGAGGLHDEPAADQLRGRKAGDSMRAAPLVVALALTLAGCGGSRPAGAGGRRTGRRAAAGVGHAGGRLLHRAGATAVPSAAGRRARRRPGRRSLRTTGTVDWDNDHTTQAITQVSGPITRILVDTGARVKTGDAAALRQQPRHHQRHLGLPQGEEPPRPGAAQPRSQQGPARAQGALAARLRVGAGRLQRRGDRRADVAARR